MSESIKKLLGLKEEADVTKMSGEKILKAAIKSGKISKEVIIEFDGHKITDDDKKSIACMLIKETDIDTMNEFMDALNKELNQSSIRKRKVVVPEDTNKKTPNTTNSTAKIKKKKTPIK